MLARWQGKSISGVDGSRCQMSFSPSGNLKKTATPSRHAKTASLVWIVRLITGIKVRDCRQAPGWHSWLGNGWFRPQGIASHRVLCIEWDGLHRTRIPGATRLGIRRSSRSVAGVEEFANRKPVDIMNSVDRGTSQGRVALYCRGDRHTLRLLVRRRSFLEQCTLYSLSSDKSSTFNGGNGRFKRRLDPPDNG